MDKDTILSLFLSRIKKDIAGKVVVKDMYGARVKNVTRVRMLDKGEWIDYVNKEEVMVVIAFVKRMPKKNAKLEDFWD